MAFVRFLGRLGTTPAMRINLSNRNGHQLATSRLLSSTPLLSAAVQKPLAAPKDGGKKDQLDTSFSDPIAAFKSKTTFELIRGYLVYLICSSETLVENNMKVSLLMSYVVHSLDGRRVETDLRHCDSFDTVIPSLEWLIFLVQISSFLRFICIFIYGSEKGRELLIFHFAPFSFRWK